MVYQLTDYQLDFFLTKALKYKQFKNAYTPSAIMKW